MDSLFDDPDFVAALDKLDFLPDVPQPGEFGYRRTLAEWAAEEGLLLSPPDDSFQEVLQIPRRRALNALAYAGLVVIGAAAGAAAAVLVFQERVAVILAMN